MYYIHEGKCTVEIGVEMGMWLHWNQVVFLPRGKWTHDELTKSGYTDVQVVLEGMRLTLVSPSKSTLKVTFCIEGQNNTKLRFMECN